MTTRPVIFISAVSRELTTARQSVANCLTALGYTPDFQDIFPMASGPLLQMLRDKVDRASAVIQVVGESYGAEPEAPPPGFERCSYTQFEALYALQRGKKVYYLFTGPGFPADPHPPEPDDLRTLQSTYRTSIKATSHLRYPAATLPELENTVLRLRDDLAQLRIEAQRWAADTTRGIGTLDHKLDALLQALRSLPAATAQAASGKSGTTPAERIAAAYETLERDLKLPPGTLKSELPALAARLLQAPDTSALDRAYALFAEKKYAESETAALAAHAEALRRQPPDITTAIQALEAAGSAATAQIHYPAALAHYEKAADLTSQDRDPVEWARVRWRWALAVYYRGDTLRAVEILHTAILVEERLLGPEHPATLASRNILLGFVWDWRAEPELKMLGIHDDLREPGHLGTFVGSKGTSADARVAQHLRRESELEHPTDAQAAVQALTLKLGSEHPRTLASRNYLAERLRLQGKSEEADVENRAVLAIEARVLGAEHPETLASRNNLANALWVHGKYAEAEEEHRTVLAATERVLGPEHPETSRSHYNLALCLATQKKLEEAKREAGAAFAGRRKMLGEAHPHTVQAKKLVDQLEGIQPPLPGC